MDVGGSSSQNFWSNYDKLNRRGWSAAQGAWQYKRLPEDWIVKWNVPITPEQLGPGNFRKLQQEAKEMGLAFTMRQRSRDRGKLQ